MINVVIFTRYEEHMQGIIRGIEQVDIEHKIAIVHGAFNLKFIDEANKTIADLTNAIMIVTQHISFPWNEEEQREVIPPRTVVLQLPASIAHGKAKREDVIDYIVNNGVGEKLLKEINAIYTDGGHNNLLPKECNPKHRDYNPNYNPSYNSYNKDNKDNKDYKEVNKK